jgi:light-regulated signal transduction histidine kinase (bacteriophytochrome)
MNEPAIPWTRLAAFFRQHTHDVRNDLNGIDLEMELLHEVQTEPEDKDSVSRIRKQLRFVEQRLRSLSTLFQEPSPEPSAVSASVLMQIWREKHAALPDAVEVRWVNQFGAEQVSVDEEMMARIFKELLENAAAFPPSGPVTVTGMAKDGMVVFEMMEPKKKAVNPGAWQEPLHPARHGHYGLGLWMARRMAEANRAAFQQHYDEKEHSLVTRISLTPCR